MVGTSGEHLFLAPTRTCWDVCYVVAIGAADRGRSFRLDGPVTTSRRNFRGEVDGGPQRAEIRHLPVDIPIGRMKWEHDTPV